LVTGASEGIGRAFAHDLARNGFNITIVSRSEEKLSYVKSALEKEGAQVEVIPLDLTKATD
jgi:short-subunit dehydrogenase